MGEDIGRNDVTNPKEAVAQILATLEIPSDQVDLDRLTLLLVRLTSILSDFFPKQDAKDVAEPQRPLESISGEEGKCDYCGQKKLLALRSSPYMADKGKWMCKPCWNLSRERGKEIEEIDIGPFNDCTGTS
jgi:hypothetical protein